VSENVHNLRVERGGLTTECVSILEDTLARAKAGELRTVIVLTEDADGFGYAHSKIVSVIEMLGRIEVLKTLLIEAGRPK
jgi:hypothetical protein